MLNQKWDYRFLDLAALVASWSKDPSTKVGAVVVNQQRRIVSTGYNGFPAKVPDLQNDLDNREVKYKKIIHAECNALIFAKQDLTDCCIYLHPFISCGPCTAQIIQSGIARVVTRKITDVGLYARWKDSITMSLEMYRDSGIEVLEYV